ncbi:MAG: hypothetical protein Q4G40_09955 [Brachybacterium sp.]|nr:hypothetical protein [Brachybacterium sp.]
MPWRDITPAGTVSGRLLVMRDGQTIWLDPQDWVPSATAQSSMILEGVLPDGLRPVRSHELALAPRVHDAVSETKGAIRVYPTGSVALYRVPAGGTVRGLVAFPTAQDFPATDPGRDL